MKLMDIFLSGTAAVALGIGVWAVAQATMAAVPGSAVARTRTGVPPGRLARSERGLRLSDRPALAELKGTPVICIYGDQEGDAACPTFSPSVIRSVRLAGGHHYDGDFAAVSQAILGSLPK